MSLTSISKLPKEVMKHYMCKLLHEKIQIWDGDYRWDEENKKMVPNIKWICKVCNGKKQ